jgi:hypothetical protein
MNFFDNIHHLFNPSRAPIELPDLADEIASLSHDVLLPQEYEDAEQVTQAILAGGRQKKMALGYLQTKTYVRPKRPMYYVRELYIPQLPYYTREMMNYLGAYLDQMVRYAAEDHYHGFLYIRRPMGPNIRSLTGIVSPEKQDQLTRFNKYIYIPAKHDFDVQNREHRFTVREVVLTIFVTMKLCEYLKNISLLARHYAEDKLPEESL